jgi:DNA-cytosine methyltransferase
MIGLLKNYLKYKLTEGLGFAQLKADFGDILSNEDLLKLEELDKFYDTISDKVKYFSAFAGIGGIEAAAPKNWECVGVSEIDISSWEFYKTKYPNTTNFKDINTIDWDKVPSFNIFFGGFPCQPFSRIGKKLGLKDPIKGLLIIQVIRCLNDMNPGYAILENVKGFATNGNLEFLEALANVIGYTVTYKMYNSSMFIPNNRERIFILLKRNGLEGELPKTLDIIKDLKKPFDYIVRTFTNKQTDPLYSVLEETVDIEQLLLDKTNYDVNNIKSDNYIMHNNFKYYFRFTSNTEEIKLAESNPRLYRFYNRWKKCVVFYKNTLGNVVPTITTKISNNIYIKDDETGNYRLYTVDELEKFQGFPTGYLDKSRKYIHNNFGIGNSISPVVAKYILHNFSNSISDSKGPTILSPEEFTNKIQELLDTILENPVPYEPYKLVGTKGYVANKGRFYKTLTADLYDKLD